MALSSDQCFWPSLKFNNNMNMPALGLCIFDVEKEDDVLRAVDAALACGYRLFDVSSVYADGAHLKKAFEMFLPKYDLKREDIFIVGKLSTKKMYSKRIVQQAFENSLKNLGMDYFDLYLLNMTEGHVVKMNPKHKMMRNTAWAALTDLYDNGSVNAIGVSNFTATHLQELMNENHSVVPVLNQVEWHPYFHDDELFKFCYQNEIVIQGHSPFGDSNSNCALLEDQAVKSIAKDLTVTPAQVLLVWSLQMDVATVHSSIDTDRIRTYIELNFKLNEEQMRILNKLKARKIN